MGGMFSVVAVWFKIETGDYKDPGWFKHPEGTVSYEWTGESKNAMRAPDQAPGRTTTAEFRVVKPGSRSSHDQH